MKSLLSKKAYITAVLAIAIVAVYFIFIRSKLKATMGTVPIELTIGAISILALLICFLIMVVTIIITVGILLFTRKKADIKPWTSRICRQLIITAIKEIKIYGILDILLLVKWQARNMDCMIN